MPPEKRSWDAVTNAFMQNPCLEPDSAAAIHRSDKLIKQSSGDFKFDGSPDNSIVEEVIGGASQTDKVLIKVFPAGFDVVYEPHRQP